MPWRKSSIATSAIAPTDCANFNGKWKGVCQISSNGNNSEIKTEQVIVQTGCESLGHEADHQQIFGGQVTETKIDRGNYRTQNSSLDWTASNQVAVISFDITTRAIGEYKVFKGAGNNTIQLQGDQLVQTGSYNFVHLPNNGNVNFSSTAKCVYDRVGK